MPKMQTKTALGLADLPDVYPTLDLRLDPRILPEEKRNGGVDFGF